MRKPVSPTASPKECIINLRTTPNAIYKKWYLKTICSNFALWFTEKFYFFITFCLWGNRFSIWPIWWSENPLLSITSKIKSCFLPSYTSLVTYSEGYNLHWRTLTARVLKTGYTPMLSSSQKSVCLSPLTKNKTAISG